MDQGGLHSKKGDKKILVFYSRANSRTIQTLDIFHQMLSADSGGFI